MAELPKSRSSAAVDHLCKGYESLTQLRALLLSSSRAKTSTASPAIRLLDKALQCVAAALAELQVGSASRLAGSSESNNNCTEPCKRRRIQRWTIVTSVPHFDGHQWRKYGEKHIHGSKFPRCYYKCTHSKEQGCPATKTVQQKEDEACHPPKYEAAYSMQHICKTMETNTNTNTNTPLAKQHYSSAATNDIISSTTTAPSTFHTCSCQATPTQPLPSPEPDQARLIESMLLSTEPHQTEENGIQSSSALMSPLADLDFDWEW